MESIPTQQDHQNEFDEATNKNLPHYYYPFPEWKVGQAKPTLRDNISGVWKELDLEKREKYLREREKEMGPNKEKSEDNEKNLPLEFWPHYKSDFRHVDPGALDPDRNVERGAKQRFRRAIEQLNESIHAVKGRDGALQLIANQVSGPLNDAYELLEDEDPKISGSQGGGSTRIPRGMQRLQLAYEWMLCQVIRLFEDINESLKEAGDQARYTKAREQYLGLLADLDDPEPDISNERKDRSPKFDKPRNYGQIVKWVYILPMVHEGKIKGAKVVAKWNPHISSAGVPILHE